MFSVHEKRIETLQFRLTTMFIIGTLYQTMKTKLFLLDIMMIEEIIQKRKRVLRSARKKYMQHGNKTE